MGEVLDLAVARVGVVGRRLEPSFFECLDNGESGNLWVEDRSGLLPALSRLDRVTLKVLLADVGVFGVRGEPTEDVEDGGRGIKVRVGEETAVVLALLVGRAGDDFGGLDLGDDEVILRFGGVEGETLTADVRLSLRGPLRGRGLIGLAFLSDGD
jgi:hypothetical protein